MEETGNRSVLELYISNLRQQLEDEQQAKVSTQGKNFHHGNIFFNVNLFEFLG